MKRALALVVVLMVSRCGGESATQTVTRAAEPVLPTQRPAGAKVGHWAGAYPSPDGKVLLAQWSSECEVPIAFFVRGRDAVPKPVLGKSLRDAPMSVADGWTRDGRAIVEFPTAACGSGIHKPGIYFVSLDGSKTLVQPLRQSVGP